jgi:polyhydroxybutyrate depolymerase
MRHALLLITGLMAFLSPIARAGEVTGQWVDREWTIDGVTRTGSLWRPDAAPPQGLPVVFVFHGHGGGITQAKRSFAIERAWPEAMVVYLQGLPTPGLLTDKKGRRNGWDMSAEPEQNRDVKFFDAVLASLIEQEQIDAKRIYIAGHSNGGGFVYLLWATRADRLAAVAASGSINGRWTRALTPKPALLIAGTRDPLVKYEWQEKSIEHVKQLNGCAGEPKPWGKDGLWYDSPAHAPLATIIYEGAHAPPPDCGQRIATFFRSLS